MRRALLRHFARHRSWRRFAYELLDDGASSHIATLVHRVLVLVIIISVVSVVLESVPSIGGAFPLMFDVIEYLTCAILLAEFALRIWVAPDHLPWRELKPSLARWKFISSPSGVIDFLAIAPSVVALLSPADALRAFLVLRLLRFFKLARYSPGMRSLVDAIVGERKALLACLFILGGLMLMSAALMHLAEHSVQPDAFGSIPASMYWAIITLTTVGYGDVAPKTDIGRLIASCTAVFGLVMIALPVGIIASAFAQSIQRRDFVVTWAMVARVPLFAELAAADIAEIMRYLRSRSVETGEVVVRRGDVADCMFFVASGEVEVELPTQNRCLGEGHFFGEIAVLKRTRRMATVRAIRPTRLLVLDSTDLHALMERRATVARLIRDVAEERLAARAQAGGGDLLPDEFDGPA